jgi:tRNA threonylcarbamoyladenosine biosynthesis protein TsaE
MDIRFSIDQLPAIVHQFWEAYGHRKLFVLQGPMGTGKTTFVHALCDRLGVTDPVSSPTFSLINQYTTSEGKSFYHADLYRLKDAEEAIAIGMEELIDSGDICFIEWPDRIRELLPDHTCHIEIIPVSETERIIRVK